MTGYLLQEDGTSKLTLEDGSGFLVYEDHVADGGVTTDTALVMDLTMSWEDVLALSMESDSTMTLKMEWGPVLALEC